MNATYQDARAEYLSAKTASNAMSLRETLALLGIVGAFMGMAPITFLALRAIVGEDDWGEYSTAAVGIWCASGLIAGMWVYIRWWPKQEHNRAFHAKKLLLETLASRFHEAKVQISEFDEIRLTFKGAVFRFDIEKEEFVLEKILRPAKVLPFSSFDELTRSWMQARELLRILPE